MNMTIRGFLIDLDGVVYTGGNAIPGAQETLRWLSREGYPFRFVSNTTRRSKASISRRLAEMHLDIRPEHIFTPAVAAASLIRMRNYRRIFLLTTGDVHLDFEAAGRVRSWDGADVVVVGDAGNDFTYKAMNQAFRLIQAGVPFLALEKDRSWMDTDGLSLSAGPFVAALEYATGSTAELVGKPSPVFFQTALDSMELAAGECAMIGDDAYTDVRGAMNMGMAGLLVETGKFRQDILSGMPDVPTAVLHSLADLPAYLKNPDNS
ncbi:MAG: TIGR01458 family HAD-type hydrolase [Methanolinea sp.]|jgi:HAD superfamily hydrolase (TIGR01458 family)|nr:TIGR01458 family HAD-type hydrolase [Methanolinea sp.]